MRSTQGRVRFGVSIALVGLLWPNKASATWSVIAVDPDTRQVGVAVAGCVDRINAQNEPFSGLRPGVGVVVSQGIPSEDARLYALRRLAEGASAQTIIDELSLASFDRRVPFRQYGVINLSGPPAAFTGLEVEPWAGSTSGLRVGIQGHSLVGPEVVSRSLEAFEGVNECPNRLADRLMAALEAGVLAGGDKRCEHGASFAFLRVANVSDEAESPSLDLFIPSTTDDDDNDNDAVRPIDELRVAYDNWRRLNPIDDSHCESDGGISDGGLPDGDGGAEDSGELDGALDGGMDLGAEDGGEDPDLGDGGEDADLGDGGEDADLGDGGEDPDLGDGGEDLDGGEEDGAEPDAGDGGGEDLGDAGFDVGIDPDAGIPDAIADGGDLDADGGDQGDLDADGGDQGDSDADFTDGPPEDQGMDATFPDRGGDAEDVGAVDTGPDDMDAGGVDPKPDGASPTSGAADFGDILSVSGGGGCATSASSRKSSSLLYVLLSLALGVYLMGPGKHRNHKA